MIAEQQLTDQQLTKGPGSFCVPRAAIDALLNSKATAYEICAYLVLSRFTDESGRYSTASISAVNRYTGANKVRGGPVHRSIERLRTIMVKKSITADRASGSGGKRGAQNNGVIEGDPILVDRDAWHEQTGEILPDGPTERGKVLFVLPDFGEPIEDRVWFGGNLVSGFGAFSQPLKVLKHAGDVAARLLLSMYAANDMELWGGVRPVGPGRGPWRRYEPIAGDVGLCGGGRLIRAKDQNELATIEERVSGGDVQAYWDALRALKSAGFVYEVVMVLNRNADKAKFADGSGYSAIPHDAEPYYELDARTEHGHKPEGEGGIGGVTAATAEALGHSLAIECRPVDGTYAAIVRTGQGAMIAGIYRLRFRVANPKNAGVKGAWAKIHQNNRDAFELVQRIRAANHLSPPQPPGAERTATAAAAKDDFLF